MSLQAKLDALSATFEAKVSPETLSVIKRATAGLISSGQAERALSVGDRAPAFTLPDTEGVDVSSERLLQDSPLVVTFYRGVWCPYCNMDLQAIEALADQFRSLGASLVAISPQTAANSRRSQLNNRITFPILSDQGGKVADAFRLRFRLPCDLIEVYRKLGVDLESFNGEPDWMLPIPARYVIGQNGLISYADVNPDYTCRPELDILDPILSSQAAPSNSLAWRRSPPYAPVLDGN